MKMHYKLDAKDLLQLATKQTLHRHAMFVYTCSYTVVITTVPYNLQFKLAKQTPADMLCLFILVVLLQ